MLLPQPEHLPIGSREGVMILGKICLAHLELELPRIHTYVRIHGQTAIREPR